MITLSDGTTVLTLDADFYWSDEFSFSPVLQEVTRGLEGAAIIQSAALTGARPITLIAYADDCAWITRRDTLQLQAWAAIVGQVLTLDMPDYNKSASVMFRHQDGALEFDPRPFYADPEPDDWGVSVLRFMEV